MTPLQLDPAFSAGLRHLLIQTASHPPRRRRPRLRWTIGLAIAGISLLSAGGAVAATYLLPGADDVNSLSTPTSIQGTGAQTLDLPDPPAGTNSLDYSLTCLSPGHVNYPDGSSSTCGDSGDTTSDSTPWSATAHGFDLDASPGMRWRFTYTYSQRHPTALQTNAAGQTYGIDTGHAHPDLIAAAATNGRLGYIDAAQARAASCEDVHSPAEAIACTRQHAGRTTFIPVYESDGTTRIGVFPIG